MKINDYCYYGRLFKEGIYRGQPSYWFEKGGQIIIVSKYLIVG